MNRCTTRLALAGKCGGRGASGEADRPASSGAAEASPALKPASPSGVMAMPARHISSRRVNVARMTGSVTDLSSTSDFIAGLFDAGVGGLVGRGGVVEPGGPFGGEGLIADRLPPFIDFQPALRTGSPAPERLPQV